MKNLFSRKNSEYYLDSDNHIIYIRFFGETFSSDIVDIAKKVLDNSKSIESYNWICDFSKSKELFEFKKIESMANIFVTYSDLFHNNKMAFIIRNPKQAHGVEGLINFFNTKGINITIKKVIDKKLAYDWILEKKKHEIFTY
jgi:hypothetical protein